MSSKNTNHVPIADKTILTIAECAALTGIGQNTLEAMLNRKGCPFLFKVGRKKMIIRKNFDEFILKCRSIDAVSGKPSDDEVPDFLKNFNENLAYFPDSFAHSSVPAYSVVSHVFLEDVDDSGRIDTKFADKVKKASKMEESSEFDPEELPVGDGSLADHIKKDWEVPDYEAGRPAGAYIVNTKPVNTVVVSIAPTGKCSSVLYPTLDIWSREKPYLFEKGMLKDNIIVNDIKRETSHVFEQVMLKRGYDIRKLDLLKEPHVDNDWNRYNPFAPVVKAIREGDCDLCAFYVARLVDIFFRRNDDDSDPVWAEFACNLFKYVVFLMLDLCLEEEDRYWHNRTAAVGSPEYQAGLDKIWEKMTLYNCYEMSKQLLSSGKRITHPALDFAHKLKYGEFEGIPNSEITAMAIKLNAFSGNMGDQCELGLFAMYGSAVGTLSELGIHHLIVQSMNTLRALSGSAKVQSAVYGSFLTQMTIFTDPIFRNITSISPLRGIRPDDFAFARHIVIKYEENAGEKYEGYQYKVEAFYDEICKNRAGFETNYEGIIHNGIIDYPIGEIFSHNKVYLKVTVSSGDEISDSFEKNYLFKFERSDHCGMGISDFYVSDCNTFVSDVKSIDVVYQERPICLFYQSSVNYKMYGWRSLLLSVLMDQIYVKSKHDCFCYDGHFSRHNGTRYLLIGFDDFYFPDKMRFADMLSNGLEYHQMYVMQVSSIEFMEDMFGSSLNKIMGDGIGQVTYVDIPDELKINDDIDVVNYDSLSFTDYWDFVVIFGGISGKAIVNNERFRLPAGWRLFYKPFKDFEANYALDYQELHDDIRGLHDPSHLVFCAVPEYDFVKIVEKRINQILGTDDWQHWYCLNMGEEDNE